jgi:hypothetical protein
MSQAIENKLTVSMEAYGVKHTTEASAETNAYEFTEIVFNMMCMLGYHKSSIIEGLEEIINEHKQEGNE